MWHCSVGFWTLSHWFCSVWILRQLLNKKPWFTRPVAACNLPGPNWLGCGWQRGWPHHVARTLGCFQEWKRVLLKPRHTSAGAVPGKPEHMVLGDGGSAPLWFAWLLRRFWPQAPDEPLCMSQLVSAFFQQQVINEHPSFLLVKCRPPEEWGCVALAILLVAVTGLCYTCSEPGKILTAPQGTRTPFLGVSPAAFLSRPGHVACCPPQDPQKLTGQALQCFFTQHLNYPVSMEMSLLLIKFSLLFQLVTDAPLRCEIVLNLIFAK